MQFEFATAARIVFGAGKLSEAVPAVKSLGRRVLIVHGASALRAQRLSELLDRAGVEHASFTVRGEPEAPAIRAGVKAARAAECDVIAAIGGGSAIDAGKAIAAMLTNPGDVMDYLEVIGHSKPIEHSSAPFIAIPTTAGAGAEVTRNAVIRSAAHGVKASLRGPYLLARAAIVDPELCCGMPHAVTAATGMDALAQVIEPYLSHRANAMTDLFCVEGMRLIAPSLAIAAERPRDMQARTRMSMASLLGGLALANAGLGIVHGFAAPIGGMFDAPHGAVCAALLPAALETNLAALRARDPGNPALGRFEEIARLLTGSPHAAAHDGIQWVADRSERLAIPPLSAYGISADHVAELTARAARAGSTKGNPIPLLESEMTAILTRAL